MKKILALGLAVLMLLGACVLAEAPAAPTFEEELTEMIPVLDALAEAMNAANEDPAFLVTYDADDAEFGLMMSGSREKNAERSGR